MPVNRGGLILLAVSAIILLALAGIYELDPQGFSSRPGDYLYRLLQLFFAEGDWTADHADLPVTLELARFLAPVVTVASLLILFAEGIWTAVINQRVRFYQDHIIVVGLTAASVELIRSCHQQGLSVVVVERDPNHSRLSFCRSLYLPVLLGDAKQMEVLKRARIRRARCLISFIDDDDVNVELSLRVQEVAGQTRMESQDPLKVVLQVDNMQLGARLESYPKFFEYPQQIDVRFFNADAQAARSLFRDYAPEVYADALGNRRVHIALVGFGSVGHHVFNAALKQAHYGNRDLLQVSVLDPDADAARDAFQRECPAMSIAAQVNFTPLELNAEILAQQVAHLGLDDVTMFVVCTGTDTDNMSMSLALRQMALLGRVPNAPIFVSLRHSRGLAKLVESGQGNPEIPDGLYPFGTVEQLMRVDLVVDEHLDDVARALHEQYLAGLPQPLDLQSSRRPWSMLPEVFRNDTRAQADHINVKLRAAGMGLVSRPSEFEFPEEQVVRLAEMEKRRWNAQRASQGWVYAQTRSDLARTHPGLKSWEDSSEAERSFDVASVRELPGILQARAGLSVTREVVIGITGHRSHRLKDHVSDVETAVREQLNNIAAEYPGCEFVVLSALADGSDRLVADLAMDLLGAQLHAVLPLPYEIYKRSFGHVSHLSNQASNEEFQRFIGRAARYFELPLRFAGADLLEQDNEAGEQARAQQYALAGAYIVSRADEMIAVWDGMAANGVGGTADVVAWRRGEPMADAYQFPGHFFPAPDMTPPRIVELPT